MTIQVTTAQFDALLQEDYVRADIVDAINKATVFKSKLTRKSTVDGRRAIYPVMVGVAQGVGSRAEMAPLPDFGAGVYVDAIVNTKSNYGRFIISGQAEEFSTRKAFVEFAMRSLKDTKEGLTLDIARQLWSDGSGTMGLVNNGGGYAAGSSTITVDSAYGVLWGSLSTNTTFLLRQNMKVQIGSENNGGAGYTITSLTATTMTISPALQNAVADNATIKRNGSTDDIEGWLKAVATSAFQNSVLGLGTVYHNIDRAVYSDWQGNAIDASAALSLANIRAAKDTLFTRGGEATLCICSTQVARDYEDLLDGNQRFLPPTKLEGGYTALSHDGLPFVKDKDAPVKALNLVTTDALYWVQRGDPQWIKQGDQILQKVSGYDAKEGVLRWYANLDCDQPRKQLILYNLTVS
jgi:hypothetical protein